MFKITIEDLEKETETKEILVDAAIMMLALDLKDGLSETGFVGKFPECKKKFFDTLIKRSCLLYEFEMATGFSQSQEGDKMREQFLKDIIGFKDSEVRSYHPKN